MDSKINVIGFLTCTIALLALSVNGLSRNLPIVSFDEGYSHLFGDDNLRVLKDGKDVHLSLDERTGSGFVSQDIYFHGYFSASIKLPADYTAGVVVAFYMSNAETYEKNHDEIDFEFLGNIRGRDWRIQTNIYGNGSTGFGREERYGLWFDPSEDFHQYGILWTENLIVFYVDNVPIRSMKRTQAIMGGGDFPSKPMSLYATIWDGSTWATNGGKYGVNYRYAPYVAQFSNFVLRGCSVDPSEQQHNPECKEPSIPSGLTLKLISKMKNFRIKYMTYSYCYDLSRYEITPSECAADPKEAQRLRAFDPSTFGGSKRGRKRSHRSSSSSYMRARASEQSSVKMLRIELC